MSLLNALAGRLFDLALLPFRHLPPIAGLAVVSLATAVAVLLVFRATSDERRLAAVKRQIQAAIFEIRLFNDDIRAILRAVREIVQHDVTYLRLTLLPMACTIALLVPVVPQLQSHYGYEGLFPGRPVLVTARLRDGSAPSGGGGDQAGRGATGSEPAATLEVPAGIEVQTPAVWIPATREVMWRIAPLAAGDYELHVVVRGERAAKTVHVSSGVARRSPVRPERGLLNELRYPAEPPLPDGGSMIAIRVAYPERRINVFGLHAHWIVIHLLLSMAWALALRRPLGVTL